MVEGKGFCDLLPWEFFLSQNFLFFNYTNDPLFFIIDNVRGVIEPLWIIGWKESDVFGSCVKPPVTDVISASFLVAGKALPFFLNPLSEALRQSNPPKCARESQEEGIFAVTDNMTVWQNSALKKHSKVCLIFFGCFSVIGAIRW